MRLLKLLNFVLGLGIAMLIVGLAGVFLISGTEDAPAPQEQPASADTPLATQQQDAPDAAPLHTPAPEDDAAAMQPPQAQGYTPEMLAKIAEAEAKRDADLAALPEIYREAVKQQQAGLTPPADPPAPQTRPPLIFQKRNEEGRMQSSLFEPPEAKPVTLPPRIEKLPAFQINGIASADMTEEVFVINMFSVWCDDCVREMVLFQDFTARYGLPMYGINIFPREDDDIALFYEAHGNPFKKWGKDNFLLVSGAFNLSSTPATYIVRGADRKILWRHEAEITPDVFENDFAPAMAKYSADPYAE